MNSSRKSWVAIAVMSLAMLLVAGATPPSCSSTAQVKEEPAKLEDSAGKAVSAAQAAMKGTAPDAVPIMVSTGGVSLSPPPQQWSVMMFSPSTKKSYSVAVSHAKAETPRELGELPLSDADVAGAIPYGSLKVGSDQAYEKAKAALAKSGEVPPQLMMNITLLKLEGLPDTAPAVWRLSFMQGTSREGSRKATVDARTGATAEQPQ